jgi:hydrogenase small subunit
MFERALTARISKRGVCMITRRDFLKYAAASAGALGLSQLDLFRLSEAFASSSSPAVIWLQASSCSGCSVSFLNYINAVTRTDDVVNVLTNVVSLKFHQTVMTAAGDLAVAQARSTQAAAGTAPYVLVVQGAIPTADGGHHCHVWDEGGAPVTALDALTSLAGNASKILAIGCACYGGIPAAAPNLSGARGVQDVIAQPVINIPGCPPHPDWIVGTIADLLLGNPLPLDSNGRPTKFFPGKIHSTCPRRTLPVATNLGESTCMIMMGCQGPNTDADCNTRLWNDGTNWCIGANAPCNGCTQPGFPDATSPFYR